ncbi:MAG: hypothetical protein R8K20_07675 [Gallionellaceae bacterium]
MNTIELDGLASFIRYCPEVNRIRGEFQWLDGGAYLYCCTLERISPALAS